MQRQKLFIMAIMMGSIVTYNCYAAEPKIVTSNESPKPIMLDKGLLTLVPSLLISVNEKGWFNPDYFMGNITEKTTKETLISLMASNYAKTSCYDGKVDAFSLVFYPTVIQITENKILKNLGSFCKLLHKEAKEACRLKQAAFYPHKQGAIIYSLDSKFNLDFFESKQIEIEGMLDENAKKQIDDYLPVFAHLR